MLYVLNWKAGMSKDVGLEMARRLAQLVLAHNFLKVVIAPSYIMIPDVSEIIAGSGLKIAAQNCSHLEPGPYTGEVPAKTLREYGCAYVMIGHSERRKHYAETSDMIMKKISMIKTYEMIPILCVGNDHPEESAEKVSKTLIAQIDACLPKDSKLMKGPLVIAYEPIWAIGGSKDIPPVDYIKTVMKEVRKAVYDMIPIKEENLEIIYGGSVNEHNYKNLLKEQIGMLFGKASLNLVEISNILKYSCDFSNVLANTE